MSTHIRILGWLHIAMGVFGLLAALGIFASSVFGGLFSGSLTGIVGATLGGAFAAIIAVVFAIPGLIAGWGLLQRAPWARTVTIVLSIFSLLRWPMGTIIGVYGLWVLLSSEGAAQFHSSPDF